MITTPKNEECQSCTGVLKITTLIKQVESILVRTGRSVIKYAKQQESNYSKLSLNISVVIKSMVRRTSIATCSQLKVCSPSATNCLFCLTPKYIASDQFWAEVQYQPIKIAGLVEPHDTDSDPILHICNSSEFTLNR